MTDKNHCFDDEELHCLLEAKRLFKEGCAKHSCESCHTAWSLIDQAILAKYTELAKKQKEK